MSKELTLWIARDKDRTLYIFREEPKRIIEHGVYASEYNYFRVSRELYPEITYENRPKKCKLVIED